jgi:hypothetical protein
MAPIQDIEQETVTTLKRIKQFFHTSQKARLPSFEDTGFFHFADGK